MKNRFVNYIIAAGGIGIVLLQVFVSKRFTRHVGTDDKSVDLITEIAPDYKPWASNIWEHTNDSTEILIFALQAAIGLSIIIFYIVKQRNKRVSE